MKILFQKSTLYLLINIYTFSTLIHYATYEVPFGDLLFSQSALLYVGINLAAYLLGSIPFGYLLVRLIHKKDIRAEGSGNIGATNVWRICGPVLGILTFVLDAGKAGIFLLFLAKTPFFDGLLDQNRLLCTGFFAFIGHLYPIWFNYKGGKGIATLFGLMLAADPMLFLCMASVWGLVFLFTRQSFMGGLSAALTPLISLGVWAFVWAKFWIYLTLFVLVLIKHLPNIKKHYAAKKS